MSTAQMIDGVVDAIITRVNNNLVALNLGGIEERAEDPATLDKVRQYGSWAYIVPLAEGRDRMDIMQGSPSGEMYHNFSINIPAYFNMTSTVSSDGSLTNSWRTTRDNGYNLIDLFTGNNSQIGYGFVFRAELESGYYQIVDQLITTYNVKFFVKVLEIE